MLTNTELIDKFCLFSLGCLCKNSKHFSRCVRVCECVCFSRKVTRCCVYAMFTLLSMRLSHCVCIDTTITSVLNTFRISALFFGRCCCCCFLLPSAGPVVFVLYFIWIVDCLWQANHNWFYFIVAGCCFQEKSTGNNRKKENSTTQSCSLFAGVCVCEFQYQVWNGSVV